MPSTLDPKTITIGDRQRHGDAELSDEFVTSVCKRLIHPIVLRRVEAECDHDYDTPDCPHTHDSQTILVAGGRRLAALIKGEIGSLVEGTHFRYMDDLSPLEARTVELEENAKRLDLPWRDYVQAVGGLHAIYEDQNEPGWTLDDTARELNFNKSAIYKILLVFKNLGNPSLKDAGSINQAYSILQVIAERRASDIISQISQTGTEIFNPPPSEIENVPPAPDNSTLPDIDLSIDLDLPEDSVPALTGTGGVSTVIEPPKPTPVPVSVSDSIICADFLAWVESYSGPKFNLVHCDFPYDIDYSKYAQSTTSTSEDYDFKGFQILLDSLCENLDRFVSYSAHILFWFSMDFYEQTRQRLEKTDLYVHKHPMIWHKTDNAGIIPGQGNQFPRRVYETALLCSRGKRPLIRSLSNAYGAPTASNPLHPSQKPEPVLRHFLSMLIDETTDVLDPTCGSGSAIRVAESLGARTSLGLEINPEYARTANAATVMARNLRKLAKS